MTFEILPILIHPSILWHLSRSGWGASNLSIATQNPSPHLLLSVLSWDNKMLHMTPNPKMSSIGVRSGECAGNWSIMYTLSCTRHQFEIIQRWVDCVHKRDGHSQQEYVGTLWNSNNAHLVLSGPLRKVSPTPLHSHQQAEAWIEGRMDPSHII